MEVKLNTKNILVFISTLWELRINNLNEGNSKRDKVTNIATVFAIINCIRYRMIVCFLIDALEY